MIRAILLTVMFLTGCAKLMQPVEPTKKVEDVQENEVEVVPTSTMLAIDLKSFDQMNVCVGRNDQWGLRELIADGNVIVFDRDEKVELMFSGYAVKVRVLDGKHKGRILILSKEHLK